MKNNYNLEKIIDSLYNKGQTNFIIRKDLNAIKKYLNKKEYNIYEPYKEAEKIILYQKNIPILKLFKISCSNQLRHQDILGTIFSLGIKDDTFGDIVKYQEDFYIFLLPNLSNYIKTSLIQIKKYSIELIEEDISFAQNLTREYQISKYIVTSLRLDNAISTIIGTSRKEILEKFKNKEIVYNYDDNPKPAKELKENDVFSIKKYGKYKYEGIEKITKKGSYIIIIKKYI